MDHPELSPASETEPPESSDQQKQPKWYVFLWQDYWPKVVTWGGNLALLFAPFLIQSACKKPLIEIAERGVSFPCAGWWLLGIGVVVSAIGQICDFVKQRRLSTLRKENTRLLEHLRQCQTQAGHHIEGYRQHINDELRSIALKLGFTTDDRVSVYKHEDGSFVMLGRHSNNPTLKAPSQRPCYPEGIGVIGKAWEEIVACESSLPAFSKDPHGYIKRHEEKWGISAKDVRAMRMKSCWLLGYRIDDDTGTPAAVVVIESMKPGGGSLTKRDLVKAFEDELAEQILLHVRRHSDFEPSLTNAGKEGY